MVNLIIGIFIGFNLGVIMMAVFICGRDGRKE